MTYKELTEVPNGTIIINNMSIGYLVTKEYLYPSNPNEPYTIIRFHKFNHDGFRVATEEETNKFFETLKSNGYFWNTHTETVEELPITLEDKKLEIIKNKLNSFIYDILIKELVKTYGNIDYKEKLCVYAPSKPIVIDKELIITNLTYSTKFDKENIRNDLENGILPSLTISIEGNSTPVNSCSLTDTQKQNLLSYFMTITAEIIERNT